MQKHQGLRALLTVGLTVLAMGSAQAGIEVGGGSIALGGGTIDLGCGTLAVGANGSLAADSGLISNAAGLINAGQLTAGAGRFEISGQWVNSGSFVAGQSTVALTDQCNSETTIGGESSFWNLSVNGLAKQLTFAAGTVQRVVGALSLRGQSEQDRLLIRSSVPGQAAFLDVDQNGSQDIFFVDVQDNHAPPEGQALAPGRPADFASVDAGGNRRWFMDALVPAIPVNSLTPVATLLLAMLLLLAGTNGHRLLGSRAQRTGARIYP